MARHSELCRIDAINRQVVKSEAVNHLRSFGDTFITEPQNAGRMVRRAKETTKNSSGRLNKKADAEMQVPAGTTDIILV